jgi:ferric-dicitrate binding protein FerR (iron transport regulator)
MNSNQVEIEAGEWLARLDRDPSAAELAAFDRWRATDARNVAAYARLAATWQALDRIRAIRPSAEEPIDNDYLNGSLQRSRPEPLHDLLPDALQSAAADSQDSQQHPSSRLMHDFSSDSLHDSAIHDSQLSKSHWPLRPSSLRRPWPLTSIAACLTIVIAYLWGLHTVGGPITFSTNIGGFQRIVLKDRSVIELNTDSEVRVALTPRLRRLELVRGEAFFEVAQDAVRPFIVSAGRTAVRAVGTKFDVRRLGNAVEVTVDEGKVSVGEPSPLESQGDLLAISIPLLTAGQSALTSGDGVQLKQIPKREMARKLAWQNQMLEFDSDTLADVAAQFNRYNRRQLVIADPRLATLRIGGYFRPTNLDAFIDVLQSDFGVSVNPDGNRLLLVTAKIN